MIIEPPDDRGQSPCLPEADHLLLLHYSDCVGSWWSEEYGDIFIKAWAVEVTV